MKNNYVIRAQKFIEDIFPYIENNLANKKFLNCFMNEAIENFCYEKRRRVIYARGCSRACFISSDYVVKYDYFEGGYFGDSKSELKAYQEIVKLGYEYLFAEITPYSYHNYTFYIMPRIKNINERREDDELYDYLNEEESEFLTNYFEDLHSGNYGFKDGMPVSIDYACTMF